MSNKWKSKPPLGTPIIPSWRTDPQYLKLWLPFQEGGGNAYDLSGNRNHGTLTNMANPPTDTSGRAGSQGLRFDGVDDYVRVANSDSVKIGLSDFSMSGWFKTSGWIGAETRMTILNKETGAANGMIWGALSTIGYTAILSLVGGVTSLRVSLAQKTAGVGTAKTSPVTNATINLNQWYYFTFIRSGDNMYLYINGVLANTTTGVGAIDVTQDAYLEFGNTSYGTDDLFNGIIDDVRIYNRGLSAAEVKELFVDRYGDFKPPCSNFFLNTGTLFEATIYDTIAITESLNKQSNIQQSDSITLAEMIRLTRFQTIIDTIEITDLISRQSVELVKSDSVTMIDSLVKGVDISVNDSIEIVDLLTKQVNLIISDSVSLSDGTITKQISISINDIIAIIDSLSKIIDINLDDSVEIIEILTKFITYVMPIADTIEVTDLISRQNITIVRTDTIEMVDNVEKSITLTLEDNISLTDIIQLLIQLNLDGDSFSITVADPAIIVATRRFRITVNIKKGQGSNILKKGQTTIDKL